MIITHNGTILTNNEIIINFVGNIALDFITAHEAATETSMDTHQQTIIYGFIDRLKGMGTVYGSDLLTKFINYGTLLFPLCPSSDSVATAAGYEIDLLSATKQGQYTNFLAEDIVPSGATGGVGKYFYCFKGPANYPLLSGADWVYQKDITPDGYSSASFGTADVASRLISRLSGNGWSYPIFNGNFDATLIGGRQYKGLMGVHQRLGVRKQSYVERGISFSVYGNYASTPNNNSATNMYYHGRNTSGGKIQQLQMYCTRTPQLTDNEIADFTEAVDWYQDNILSNASRKYI
jgi:hypothetical protein